MIRKTDGGDFVHLVNSVPGNITLIFALINELHWSDPELKGPY